MAGTMAGAYDSDSKMTVAAMAGADDPGSKRVVTDMFSPPRVNESLRASPQEGLAPGTSFDLIVDSVTGERWDFLKANDRKRAWTRLEEEDPWLVIGSPPCTDVSILNVGLNYPKMDPEEVQRRLARARILLWFTADVYAWQIRRGRYFLHEHPVGALSWEMEETERIAAMPHVSTITSDGCMFGMRAMSRSGEELPARKPTKWMGNAPKLLEQLRMGV